MKPSNPNAERTRQLFAWLQRYQPKVHAGLIRRFTPRERLALSGIFDFIGTAVNAATNFVNTQGFDKLLTAATPFLQNKVEKSQLSIQLERIKAGLPPTAPTAAPGLPAPTSTSSPAAPNDVPWYQRPTVLLFGGGTALLVGAMLFMGRRSSRRA